MQCHPCLVVTSDAISSDVRSNSVRSCAGRTSYGDSSAPVGSTWACHHGCSGWAFRVFSPPGTQRSLKRHRARVTRQPSSSTEDDSVVHCVRESRYETRSKYELTTMERILNSPKKATPTSAGSAKGSRGDSRNTTRTTGILCLSQSAKYRISGGWSSGIAMVTSGSAGRVVPFGSRPGGCCTSEVITFEGGLYALRSR